MRCFRLLRARKDIVELLVRQGRLADIQMLNFFSIQLDREVNAAERKATAAAEANTLNTDASAAATTTTTAATGKCAPSAEVAKAAAEAAQKAQSLAAKKAAWTSFHSRSNAVRQLAAQSNPAGWLKEVYGSGEEWSSSYLTGAHAVATRKASDASGKLHVTGVATAVGSFNEKNKSVGTEAASGSPQLPSSIQVVLRLETDENTADDAGPTFVTATVRLDQPGVVEKRLLHQGMLQVRLNGAEATLKASLSAQQVAGSQHVLTAVAYSAMLAKMQEVAALHATNTVRYEALLLRNPAVQMRLAQLACFRYGIDCLTDYVVGDPEVEETDEAAELRDRFSALLQLPLIESMALNIYAERALMDGMDGIWEMVRDTPLLKAVPHRSNPQKQIDYPYLAELLNSSKYVLTAADGSMEEQALTFLTPLLSRGLSLSEMGSGISGVFQRLAGLAGGQTRGGFHLAAPHVNLTGMAATLERDIEKLVQLVHAEKDRTEPTFVISAAQYLSEVLANLAVIYRCTAALNIDEEGRGHREWLLAQAFGTSSAVRRQRILDDYKMGRAAAKVIRRSKDLDNYSTHPMELMNASPQNGRAATTEPLDNKGQP